MKKILLPQAVCVLSFLFISSLSSQSTDYLIRAYQFINEEFGLDQGAIGELKIKDQYHTDHNNVEHVYLTQTFNDIELYGTSISLTFLPNGKIINTGHRLKAFDHFPLASGQPVVTQPEAIGVVANSLGITSRSIPTLLRFTNKGIPVFDKKDIALQDIPVELVYLVTKSNEFQLVWKILFESSKNGNLYQSYVDAISGNLVANDNMTLHCQFENGYLNHDSSCEDHYEMLTPPSPPIGSINGQYRILPLTVESPNHGNFELVTGVDDLLASPFGWHDTNGAAGAEYTYTRGNNVHAFLDGNWDYNPDLNVDGGANLIFDFPFNSNGELAENQNVAVTNLFYWNNIMHDFAYQYGFNEVAGNYQEHNYSGQGANEDYVEALAQFGRNNTIKCGNESNDSIECINNASFSISPDGFNGLMVMYVWNLDNGSKYLDVLEPVELSGKVITGLANFGPDLTTEAITGEVVVIDDGTFVGSHGCNPVTGQPELEGKIALIDRGTCDFSLKVYNAQEAGAISAIICNFEDAILPMGAGEHATDVTIPSVFITNTECNRIRIAAGSGLVVSLVAPGTGGPVYRDGSLDNSIVSHEYSHGISNRLTGGPGSSGCLIPNASHENEEAHGMSEGWSDFFALVTTVRPGDTGTKRRGIGTYVSREQTNGKGLRLFPYCTDMTINPQTFSYIQSQVEEHSVGPVWCTMIWDLYWALSDAYGWDPDLYHGTGGNNIAIQLVMDGLKIQPCNPGFIDARDAILAADLINNGGANQCLIWNVFARRGLGFNALGGDPDLKADGKEGFELPIACRSDLSLSKTMTPEVIAGQEITVTLRFVNYMDETLTNVFFEDPVPEGCTYLTGSANIEPTTGNTLVWSIPEIAPDEEVVITYLLATDQNKPSLRQYFDDIEGLPEQRWDIYYDPNGNANNFWYKESILVHSGVGAWHVEDVDVKSQHFLQNYQPYTISGDYPVYRFYHYYDTEIGLDGGFLEISTDDGDSWIPLENKIFRNSYPSKIQYTTFVIPNLYAYTGLSSPDMKMTPVYIDLTDYIGENVKIRYRFGTDASISGDGWYVDDVEIMDAVIYNSEACVSSDQTNPLCAEAPERGTIVDSQITIATDDGTDNSTLGLMPNPAGDLVQVVLSATRAEDAVIHVYNLTGHLMTTKDWALTQGINQNVIDISRFTPGMYVIQVSTGEGMNSKKFIKE